MIDYDKIAGNMRPDCVKDDGSLREPIAKLAKQGKVRQSDGYKTRQIRRIYGNA